MKFQLSLQRCPSAKTSFIQSTLLSRSFNAGCGILKAIFNTAKVPYNFYHPSCIWYNKTRLACSFLRGVSRKSYFRTALFNPLKSFTVKQGASSTKARTRNMEFGLTAGYFGY